MKKALLIFVIFLLSQFVMSGVMAALFMVVTVFNGQPDTSVVTSVPFLVSTLLASTVVTVWILISKKLVSLEALKKPVEWKVYVGFVAFMLALTFCMNVVLEVLNLPDFTRNSLSEMSNSVFGALIVAILGPIAEELAFRGGIIDAMRQKGYTAFRAMLVSSVLFGLVHMNPTQTVFAVVMGMALGWAYVRTGSLLVPILMHIANNSLAVISYIANGNEEPESVIKELGGPIGATMFVVGCIAIAYFLYRYLVGLTEGMVDEKISLESDDFEKITEIDKEQSQDEKES